jgi:hypothetical protein
MNWKEIKNYLEKKHIINTFERYILSSLFFSFGTLAATVQPSSILKPIIFCAFFGVLFFYINEVQKLLGIKPTK